MPLPLIFALVKMNKKLNETTIRRNLKAIVVLAAISLRMQSVYTEGLKYTKSHQTHSENNSCVNQVLVPVSFR